MIFAGDFFFGSARTKNKCVRKRRGNKWSRDGGLKSNKIEKINSGFEVRVLVDLVEKGGGFVLQ